MRQNLEQLALEPFEVAARQTSRRCIKGQGSSNRVLISGNVYWQFGDLRVDLPDRHVIVEVESAGDVTNLLKYWQCLAEGSILQPVYLLHGFRQGSVNDYASHVGLWRFMFDRMKRDLGERFDGMLFTYRSDRLAEDIQPAVARFKAWLLAADA